MHRRICAEGPCHFEMFFAHAFEIWTCWDLLFFLGIWSRRPVWSTFEILLYFHIFRTARRYDAAGKKYSTISGIKENMSCIYLRYAYLVTGQTAVLAGTHHRHHLSLVPVLLVGCFTPVKQCTDLFIQKYHREILQKLQQL